MAARLVPLLSLIAARTGVRVDHPLWSRNAGAATFVLHTHMPKTGGTALNTLLQGPFLRSFHSNRTAARWYPPKDGHYLDARAYDHMVYFGHEMQYGEHERICNRTGAHAAHKCSFAYIIELREPLTWAVSQWNYHRRSIPARDPSLGHIHACSFHQYWFDFRGRNPHANFGTSQTGHLMLDWWRRHNMTWPIADLRLERRLMQAAKERLETAYDVVLLNEYPHYNAVLMHTAFGNDTRADWTYALESHQVNSRHVHAQAAAWASPYEQAAPVDAAEAAWLMRVHLRLDVELYEWAKQLFFERLAYHAIL
jgi:hypothetical protein